MEETTLYGLLANAETNSEAFARIFEQYLPLVYKVVRHYYLRDFSEEDWLQEARMAMFNAVKRFDRRNGTTFGSYYAMVLRSHMNSLVRRHLAKKRAAYSRSVVMADPIDRAKEKQLGQHVEDSQLMGIDLERLLKQLTPLEVQVLYAALNGTIKDQEPSVQYARERTKRKLERYITEFYR